MGNLKQRFIKAGRDFNYAEGVKVKASSTIYADQIVCVDGSEGPFLTVVPADADGGVASTGRLMIAKHDIPVNGYGIVLPWKLVTTVATDGAGVALGDPVFLDDTVTAGVAGNLTLATPFGNARAVLLGRVTKLGAAGTGSILVHADAPEESMQGGVISAAGEVVGRQMEQIQVTTPASDANIDLTFPYPIIVTDVHAISAGASTGANATVQNGTGGNEICTPFAFGTIRDITRAVEIVAANQLVAAGDTLRVTKSAAGTVADLIVITFIRG